MRRIGKDASAAAETTALGRRHRDPASRLVYSGRAGSRSARDPRASHPLPDRPASTRAAASPPVRTGPRGGHGGTQTGGRAAWRSLPDPRGLEVVPPKAVARPVRLPPAASVRNRAYGMLSHGRKGRPGWCPGQARRGADPRSSTRYGDSRCVPSPVRRPRCAQDGRASARRERSTQRPPRPSIRAAAARIILPHPILTGSECGSSPWRRRRRQQARRTGAPTPRSSTTGATPAARPSRLPLAR